MALEEGVEPVIRVTDTQILLTDPVKGHVKVQPYIAQRIADMCDSLLHLITAYGAATIPPIPSQRRLMSSICSALMSWTMRSLATTHACLHMDRQVGDEVSFTACDL